jgi:Terminase large subunit, T4likevirus-type, N-terminal
MPTGRIMAESLLNLAGDFSRALDPILLARDVGIEPDATQAALLLSGSKKVLVNCCRQWGKSTTTALIALHAALYEAPAMVIIVAPSMPQSVELFRKLVAFYANLPDAPKSEQETLTRMQLRNGSRIISLPGSEKTVRGYSGATLVIADEAARVPDELYVAVRPMLATTNGRFVALSTPAGKRGWFYEQWQRGEGWERISVAAKDCSRISEEFLASQRKEMGDIEFRQEYMCEFLDNEQACFTDDLIAAALTDDFQPFAWAA